jgi:outer membrane protein
LSLKVDSKTTFYFGLAYNFTDNWQFDLAMGVPPKHEVDVVVLNPNAVTPEMAATNGQAAAYVTQFAPTAFINYVFGSKTDSFRPYLGLGMNYTKFTKADSTATNDNLNGGPTTIGLTSSKGAAAQIGFSQKINGQWSAYASYATAKVHTVLTSDTLGIDRTSDIKFKPAAITLAIGRSF